ncbi:leucine--tRNA ligase [Aquihabitans sp. G128]|uniref:leucine--tRNA ligase n=1 Tax=Aquihabitans sp. G128 TaxID=2849779 RepID=UPI001C21DA08|nr:leucine--tRNA ligase [Aquihabitans sp. G128]QXC61519.1 leucine--tRNA ligase [Aquihabitans sp. G128]
MADPTSNDAASDLPVHRYDAALAQVVEARWQDRWDAEGTFHAPNPVGELSTGFEAMADRPKHYVLDMFPYPSGVGLHVGHPLGFIGTDVYARYLRMTGHNVVHTMGYDAFGLPAEQFALKTNTHPRVTTEANVANMRRQLRRLGLGHDPRRSVSTTDVDFYRWTQWIFLQIFGSWYDVDADRARPIAELEAELDAGTRQPAAGTNPNGTPWADLDASGRRAVLNGHRLAYLAEVPVNWCPGLGTVLANEEVTADGRSERGNFPVYRRPMKQWMLRITAYADRLIQDLDGLDWSDAIKSQQRNWIGRSTGAQVRFGSPAGPIEVFTTRPDTLFGATYVVVAPEHPLVGALTADAWPEGTPASWTGGARTPGEAVAAYAQAASRRSELDRQTEGKDKTGVFTGSHATNPVDGSSVPVFVADYVLMGYGTGAIMAVPAHDQRDFEFARAFDLPVTAVVAPDPAWLAEHDLAADAPAGTWPEAFGGSGAATASANAEVSLDGLALAEAKATITAWLEQQGAGEGKVQYKLRDWLFSRQRYWGEPFPIVFGADGEPQALPDDLLPLELPPMEDFSPKTSDREDSEPEPPLGRVTEWTTATLDLGRGDGPQPYRREVNTMPNWAGSCWYELRYLDPTNREAFVDPANEAYWMGPTSADDCGGVDLYVGGVEHAVLHLLYARFWHKVLFDLGHVSSSEPFRRLFNQGMVQAFAYKDDRGFYVEASEVVEQDGTYRFQGAEVTREYGKMGKSLQNAVTPDEMCERYGADTLRLYEMFTGPLDQSRPWDTTAVVGMYRQLQRIWRLFVDEQSGELRVGAGEPTDDDRRRLHRATAAVRDGMETLRFNTSIARITELANHLTAAYPDGGVPRAVAEPLALLLAPLAPHVAEELWSRLGHPASLAYEDFPVAEAAWLVDDTVELPVQVNGKVRSRITVPADADRDAIEAAARADGKVAALLDGATVRKVVAVPGKLVNFVVA